MACAGAICMGCSDLLWIGIYVGILVRVCACVRDVISVVCFAHCGSWSLLPIDVVAPGTFFANVSRGPNVVGCFINLHVLRLQYW